VISSDQAKNKLQNCSIDNYQQREWGKIILDFSNLGTGDVGELRKNIRRFQIMKKKQKKFIRIASVIALFGFLALQQGILASASASHPIGITPPANRNTWATGARPATILTNTGHLIRVDFPAHAVQSRIILGTNSSPGAATAWQNHPAGVSRLTVHNSGASRGTNIRAQFRTATSRSSQFTAVGEWAP
jgi:hypothetical protein